MGNQQIVPLNIEVLKPQNWIQAGQDQQKVLFSNVNPYRKRLLANIITHELIEQYQLNFIAQQDYNNYVKQLSYRQSSSKAEKGFKFHSKDQNYFPQYIYPIRYFINKSKNQMCTTIHTGYLYVDKVDLRLKQINDIPFSDLLYIYKATLIGFKFLYQKVGYFDIQQQMIFINRKGQAKVWMNANLAKNYPNFQKNQNPTSRQMENYTESQNLYGSQADMIKDLIYLIQKNSDQNTPQFQCPLFSQYLERKNILDKLSFQHCIEQFNAYLHENNLHSSDHMKSIPELFSPEDYVNTNQTNYQQSHVNQLTSQRLNQLKKKFQPMETILEDQNSHSPLNMNSQVHCNISNPNQRAFQQSKVSTFTPQKNVSTKQNYVDSVLPFETNRNNVIVPQQQRHSDLNKSQYSQYSVNRHPIQNEKLQKSSSSNNAQYYQHLTPNSLSQISCKNQNFIQTINYPQNQFIVKQNSNKLITTLQGPVSSYNHLIQTPHYQHQGPNNSVFVVSPPPSFRIMGGINSNNQLIHQSPIFYNQVIHSQQRILQNHSIQRKNLIPQLPNFVNSQPIQPLIFNSQRQFQKISLQNNHISQHHPHLNPPPFPPKPPSNLNIQKVQSSTGSHIKKQQNLSKSNIKYFTTKNTYQIDDQIANDLQKFLGLKVN